jgi:hypothetical protein
MQRRINKSLGVLFLFFAETFAQILYLSARIGDDKIVGSFIDLFFDGVRTFGFIKIYFFFPLYLIFHISIDNSKAYLKISFQHACIYLLISLFMIFLPWSNFSKGYDFLVNFSISFLSCWLAYKLNFIRN